MSKKSKDGRDRPENYEKSLKIESGFDDALRTIVSPNFKKGHHVFKKGNYSLTIENNEDNRYSHLTFDELVFDLPHPSHIGLIIKKEYFNGGGASSIHPNDNLLIEAKNGKDVIDLKRVKELQIHVFYRSPLDDKEEAAPIQELLQEGKVGEYDIDPFEIRMDYSLV